MSSVFGDLSLYESRDLVSKFYKDRHQKALDDEKAYGIVSFLAQGREYFESAQQAAGLVRPLLLYYSVLAYARGIILYRDSSIGLANLHRSHGVFEPRGKNDFSTSIVEVPNFTVGIGSKGTFSQLTSVSRNRERAQLHKLDKLPFHEEVWLKREGTANIPQNSEVTVREVLAGIPDLCDLFERTFDERSRCFPADIMVSFGDEPNPNYAKVFLLETTKGLPEKSEVQAIFDISDPAEIDEETSLVSHKASQKVCIDFSSLDELAEKIPVIKNDARGDTFVTLPISNQLEFSSLSYLYLAAYVMGMLVRYHPVEWFKLIGKTEGDTFFPILKAAVEIVERRLPELVLQELQVS